MRRLAKAFGGAGSALAAASLTLSACSGEADPRKAQTGALIAEAKALTPEKIEAKANEISQNDYRMFRSLMAAGGLDEELGGAAQGDAALKGLMLQFRQQMLGARANLPRLIKAAGGDEVSGLTGLGASFFAGILATGTMVSISGQTKEPSGSFGADNKDGAFTGTFDQQKVTTATTFTGEMSGLTGKVTTKVTLDICPKPDGAITIDYLSDSSMTKVGGTAGANIKVTAKLTWFVTDDATFDSGGSGLDADIRVESASFGGTRGANGGFVDYTTKISSVTAANNSGVLNRSSSKATADDVTMAQAATQFALVAVMGTAYKAQDAFQSGQCVKLEPTSDPAKRSGAKPRTSFAILAAPRSKIDGTPTGGAVKATLTGAGALDPAGSKVPADAKFTYVAGEKNTKGTVAFEARSKRGVGKRTLAFDTMNRAYFAVGGADAYRGTGTICSFSAPFTISGSGVTNTFTPTSETGGTYSYTGSMSGFSVFGQGTYTVSADESGGTLTATGPGSVKTPMGVKTNKGTEVYKLIAAVPCG